jgi:hypothetical protein
MPRMKPRMGDLARTDDYSLSASPSLEELLAIAAAQDDPDAYKAEPPSLTQDALAEIIARVRKPTRTQRGPVATIGIRG